MTTYDKWLDPEVTLTPDTAAYTAGDVISGAGRATGLEFSLAGSSSGGGLINSLVVADSEGIGAAGELWLFKADLATPIADQAAFAVVFADFANLITILTLPSYKTISSMKVAVLEDINTKFQVTANRIYGYFVASGAPDWAASKSVYIRLGILTQ